MIASSDPMNATLTIIWSLLCWSSFLLGVYAYCRWKRHPDESLSHDIAVYMQQYKQRFLIGFVLGITIGIMVGVILGMFAGHWFWPVELREPTPASPAELREAEKKYVDIPVLILEQPVDLFEVDDGYDGSGFWWDHDSQGREIEPGSYNWPDGPVLRRKI